MKLKDIARRGLKGRKKDTLLINLVITLSFIFIITATIFQSSIDETKKEQSYDLYGAWHATYLAGNEETLEKLKQEESIDKLGVSLIIGDSDKTGVVGTFNQDLVDIGRLTLYKGTYPTKDNEIMLELNQMTSMGLSLEVGQKVQVAIEIDRLNQGYMDYILGLNKEFYKIDTTYKEFKKQVYDPINEELEKLAEIVPKTPEEASEIGIRRSDLYTQKMRVLDQYDAVYKRPKYYQHHETPFEEHNGVMVVASNKYFYYYMDGDEVNPDIIREKGLLTNSKIVLKREFIVTGILDSYSDKWDVTEFKVPNSFITEEAGKLFTDAFYKNGIGDFSDYKMKTNMFLYSNKYGEKIYDILKDKYPGMEIENNQIDSNAVENFEVWIDMYGKTDEEIEAQINKSTSWNVPRILEDWRDTNLEHPEDKEIEQNIDLNNFRRNTFSYPQDKTSMEYILSIAVIAVIFVATALAIFQIFFTQMRRRSRKIVLLRSIGTTKIQIVKILMFEGMYLLKNGLIFGVPLGFIASVVIVYGMNIFGGRNISYHINSSLLALGILAGCISVFVGMAVPMIFAIRIPLVGTLSKPPKHKKFKRKEYNLSKENIKTFMKLNWDYFKINKSKAMISFGISFITITIMLSTVFLCYSAFDNYREIVLLKNRPDYALETFVGERIRNLSLLEKELKSIEGITSVDTYKVGKYTMIWHEDIKTSPLVSNFESLLPTRLLDAHYAKYNNKYLYDAQFVKESIYTKLYGIDHTLDIFDKYVNSLSEGNIDKEKFAMGEEIILLVPQYRELEQDINIKPLQQTTVLDATNEDNRMSWLLKRMKFFELSYNERYKEYFKRDTTIKVGDKIILAADAEGDTSSTSTSSTNNKEFTVGGIIYYFQGEQIWPFSNNISTYAVIASYNAMEMVYPSSKYGYDYVGASVMKSMVDTMFPTKFGRTLMYVNTDSKESDAILDSKLLSFANENYYTLYNYKESNIKLYQEGFNNSLIIGLLGFTSSAIAFIILYNILVSKVEQDKNRIGILQALGVTSQEFRKHYIFLGIINGLLSLVIINILLFIISLFISWIKLAGQDIGIIKLINDIYAYDLWMYPWNIHLILNIVFFGLTVIMYYIPSRKIIKEAPVENIRSLGR